MAYETSTVTNLDSLLQTIVNFAVANAGFTEHTKVVVSGATSDMYIIQKGSIYWYFVGRLNPTVSSNYGDWGVIEARMMTVLPTAANKDIVALGQQYSTKIILYSRYNGPFQTHSLYSNNAGDSVHMALEIYPNIFAHMSFGSLNKFGTWTGGEYITGTTGGISNTVYDAELYDGFRDNYVFSRPDGLFMSHGMGPTPGTPQGCGQVYIPNDPIDGTYTDFSPMTDSAISLRRAEGPAVRNYLAITSEGLSADLFYFGSNTFNSRAALIPTYYQAYYNVNFHNGNNKYAIIGHVEDVKIINIKRIEPKEIVNDDWDTFPQVQKSGDSLVAPVSDIRGIAYKRYE